MSAEQTCSSWRIPDGLWERMESFLPKYRTSPRGGRPRAELRKIADGIFYILRTGCQWKAAPKEFSSGSTLHRYFQEWVRRGRHDQKLFRATLDSIPLRRLRPTSRCRQHLCCDKGFDADVIRREARRRRYTPHINPVAMSRLPNAFMGVEHAAGSSSDFTPG